MAVVNVRLNGQRGANVNPRAATIVNERDTPSVLPSKENMD